MNPRYTCPNVPRPRSFPFFHFDKLATVVVFSNCPFARALEREGGLVGEHCPFAHVLERVGGLVGEPGGRGSGWH